MSRKRTALFLALLVPAVALHAQSKEALEADFQENLFRAGMNMVPYEYVPGPQTPAPKGYKPFYISHYGRHGSRSNWEGREYGEIRDKYHKAADAALLTPEGLAAMEQIDALIRLHDHMDGRLTPLGALEHRQIAGRMYENYRPVFHGGSRKLTARSTMSPRVLLSMAAFTGELEAREKDLDIELDTGEQLVPLLSTVADRATRDSSARIIARLQAAHVPDTVYFTSRVFTDPAAARAVAGDTRRFMQLTYDMATGCPAFGLDDRLFRLFTLDDLVAYEQAIASRFYMQQCNSVEFGDKRMVLLNPLVSDIIEKADAAIATGEYAADLRFGHDEQVLALGSRLGLQGIAERLDQRTSLYWPGWRYTPFAANIQLIFYRNKAGDVLVKPLLNERETPLLGLSGGPYYSWEALKAWLYANWPGTRE